MPVGHARVAKIRAPALKPILLAVEERGASLVEAQHAETRIKCGGQASVSSLQPEIMIPFAITRRRRAPPLV